MLLSRALCLCIEGGDNAQVMGDIDVGALVSRITDAFRPADMTLVTTVDGAGSGAAWDGLASPPAGYAIACQTAQELSHAGGRVSLTTLLVDAPATQSLPLLAPPADIQVDGFIMVPREAPACPPVPQAAEPALLTASSCSLSDGSDGGDAPPMILPAGCDGAVPPASGIAAGARLAAVMASYAAAPLPAGNAAELDEHAGHLIISRSLEDTFFVTDLGVVAALAAAWARLMPRVRPFYAVK